MRILGPRVLIKKIESKESLESGIVIKDDGESLPKAIVVQVSKDVTEAGIEIKDGDSIYYTESRESGKVKFNGDDHYALPISNVVAVL